jgi:hypothetical protein
MRSSNNQEHFLCEMQAAVAARFPLLRSLVLSDRPGRAPTHLPDFAGLVATVLDLAAKPCCLVLPDHSGVALAVSALIAVSHLQREVPDILRAHASTALQPGDRVLVHPCDLVYEYQGFFTPKLFKLKVLNRNESRSLPVHEVARLEKTLRRMPKGYLNSELGRPVPTLLGTLVGIPGAVNRNFLRNYVLVLGSKKRLREQLVEWSIGTSSEQALIENMGSAVPSGDVTDDGLLHFFDAYVASGDPLVAVASRPEELAACCARAEPFSRAVLIDDVERVTRTLQSYDSVAECQRMVVLANESQHECVKILGDRGCEVWHLAPEEVLLGTKPTLDLGPFSGLLSKVQKMRDLVVSPTVCSNDALDGAAADLLAVARAQPTENGGSAARDLFVALFGVLMSCAEHLGSEENGFAEEITGRLSHAETLLRRAAAWLTPDAAKQIQLAVSRLRGVGSSLAKEVITSKGQALLDSTTGNYFPNHSIAFVTRSQSGCRNLQRWLAGREMDVPVYGIDEVPADSSFDELIVTAWPRARRFDRLLHLYATQKINLLAYSFERLWLTQYRQQYAQSRGPSMATSRKGKLLGIVSVVCSDENPAPQTAAATSVPSPFDIPEERFLLRRKYAAAKQSDAGEPEELIDVHYVDFSGSTFAYISGGHELPVVNNCLTGKQAATASVPFRPIDDLNVGDFVLFRESGDSDIIRSIAEDEIGVMEYRRLRATAGRWQATLRRFDRDARVVWERLRRFGFSRQLPTVRNWLANDQMIGPKDPRDLHLIAQAIRDGELLDHVHEVENAIEVIKSLHISAGFRLTRLLLGELSKGVELLGDAESELDLGFGKVWIVRIEEIDEEITQCARSLANRLLWDEQVPQLSFDRLR